MGVASSGWAERGPELEQQQAKGAAACNQKYGERLLVRPDKDAPCPWRERDPDPGDQGPVDRGRNAVDLRLQVGQPGVGQKEVAPWAGRDLDPTATIGELDHRE